MCGWGLAASITGRYEEKRWGWFEIVVEGLAGGWRVDGVVCCDRIVNGMEVFSTILWNGLNSKV